MGDYLILHGRDKGKVTEMTYYYERDRFISDCGCKYSLENVLSIKAIQHANRNIKRNIERLKRELEVIENYEKQKV